MDHQAARERRYRVEAIVGQGGMGVVYRAWDNARGHTVALKRLRMSPDGAAQRQRLIAFEREFRALAQLSHPRVVTAYDYGVDAAGPYYTMELLDGGSLRECVSDVATLCLRLRDVASVLAMLHARRLVHRDVSLRNIHCAPDGHAKLLDFGALSPIDRPAAVTGTPPFLPPEAVADQPLTARSDLFALGACAYWVLTGRHAYPAQRIADLAHVWQQAPRDLRSLRADLPGALVALVTDLLSIDPSGRPTSAGEVIERLTTIGRLPEDDSPAVVNAYLSRPPLIGRESVLRAMHTRALSAIRGQGSVLLLHGGAGSGRTRMIEECAVEGQLLGLTPTLLTVDALSSTCAELERATAAEADVRLLLLDVPHALDASVLRQLAAVAHASRTKRCLLIVAGLSPREAQQLRAQETSIHGVELAPLAVAQTRTLLSSMLGEGPGFEPLAVRLHALSAGRPRTLLRLTRQLVAEGVLRCEAGTWFFPERIDDAHLATQLHGSSPDAWMALDDAAQMLAIALAVTPPRQLTRAQVHAFMVALDDAAWRRALAQLDAWGVDVTGDPTLRFKDEAWAALVRSVCPSELRMRAQRHLANLALSDGALEQAVLHLVDTPDHQQRLELLVQLAERALHGATQVEPSLVFSERYVDAVADALRTLRARAPDSAARFLLEVMLMRLDLRGAHAERVALQHTADHLWNACVAGVPSPFAPEACVRLLARLALSVCPMTIATLDMTWLRSVPSLAPIAPLSPAIGIVVAAVDATVDIALGRWPAARRRYLEMLRQLDTPDRAGLTPVAHHHVRLGVVHGLSFLEGHFGMRSAWTWVRVLHQDPLFEIHAWQHSSVLHFARGDVIEAHACRQRAEILSARRTMEMHYSDSGLVSELAACALAEDLLGVKRALDRVRSVAQQRPGWSPIVCAGEVELDRLRGDYESALERSASLRDASCVELKPGWNILALARARALLDGRRFAQACAFCADLLRERAREDMIELPLKIVWARAEAARQSWEAAERIADSVITQAVHDGVGGLLLGRAWETRARIAALRGDASGFERHASACADELAVGHSSALDTIYRHLITDAAQLGVHAGPRLSPADADHDTKADAEHSWTATHALQRVLARTGAQEGFLYLIGDGGLRCRAARGVPPAGLEARLAQRSQVRMQEITQTVDALGPSTQPDEAQVLIPIAHDPATPARGWLVLIEPTAGAQHALHDLVQWIANASERWTPFAEPERLDAHTR